MPRHLTELVNEVAAMRSRRTPQGPRLDRGEPLPLEENTEPGTLPTRADSVRLARTTAMFPCGSLTSTAAVRFS